MVFLHLTTVFYIVGFLLFLAFSFVTGFACCSVQHSSQEKGLKQLRSSNRQITQPNDGKGKNCSNY